jgi:hypothetical protein
VPLKIDNAVGLAGGDILMAYDPDVIRAVDVSSGEGIMLASNMAKVYALKAKNCLTD